NSRMFSTLGADIGFDSIADGAIAYPLSRLLDSLDKNGELPKTILYVLNPADNDTIATMIGNFQDGKTPGKIQFGSGWWFNDQKTGMENQLISLGNMGILSKFVGMLTDSRSFLSYTRHEYFRRILCNLIGTWVTNGEAPEDYELLGSMVSNICYNNSKEYFNFI
ncbi:MAG: glucuronate isomerase, partial [Spirochaetales bacterium]|nr:glucuronate isomerase [Spirochaetales bacterium]